MAEASPVLTPEQEKTTIRDIAVATEAHTKEGDTFYLITQRCIFLFYYYYFFNMQICLYMSGGLVLDFLHVILLY